MKPLVRLLMTAWITILAAQFGQARDIKVIANPSVKAGSLTVSELRGIYLLERKALTDGSPVEPVLQKAGAAHEAFFKQYLNRDSEEVRTYYQRLVFTGKGSMPKRFGSDAEVVAYVAQTRGAIGYVSAAADTEGVITLSVVSEDRKPRTLLSRVEPEYPETLLKLRIGGTVRLELTVSPKGAVDDVVVVGGNPILGEAAVKAAKQWVYSPWPSQTKIRVAIPFEPHP